MDWFDLLAVQETQLESADGGLVMMSLVPASRAGPAEGPFLLAAVRDPEEPVRAFLGSEMWALGDGDPWSSWHDAVAWCCWRSLCQAGLNGRERETDRQTERQKRERWGEQPDDLKSGSCHHQNAAFTVNMTTARTLGQDSN